MADIAQKVTASALKKIKSKKKANLMRLHTAMVKLSENAVDREVVKKFRTIIEASESDITKAAANAILKKPEEIEIKDHHESLHPYIKHYIYMCKRIKKMSQKK